MSVMRSHSFGEQVLYVNCYTAGLGAGSSIVPSDDRLAMACEAKRRELGPEKLSSTAAAAIRRGRRPLHRGTE